MGPFEIHEPRPGVLAAFLGPCCVGDLPRVLQPDPGSYVWIPRFRPHAVLQWIDLPLPLGPGQAAEPLRARLPSFDLLMPLGRFLEALPRISTPHGLTALQMSRPVPDTLDVPAKDHVLRRNGWMLTFHLPHDGETALLECADQSWLEAVLADPALRG